MLAELLLLTPEESGLRPSPGKFEGGVKRLPTLTGEGCVGLIAPIPGNFCRSGGGSWKFGRFEAADLLDEKLAGCGPNDSEVEVICGGSKASVVATVPFGSCWWPANGRNTSDSDVGGVGRLLRGGYGA